MLSDLLTEAIALATGRRATSPKDVLGVIPIESAAFCAGCESVFHVVDRKCPRCGTTAFMMVDTWLRAKAKRLDS